MREITFTFSGPRVTAEVIASLEKQLGDQLPDDYRRFLLAQNGGTPQPAFYFATDADVKANNPRWIDTFFIVDENLISPDERADPESISGQMLRWGTYIPSDSLIIGSSVRDDRLLLRFRGQRRGCVDLKIIDEFVLGPEREWSSYPERGIVPLAASFGKFLAMLQEDTPKEMRK